jgi:hypothetical protein
MLNLYSFQSLIWANATTYRRVLLNRADDTTLIRAYLSSR